MTAQVQVPTLDNIRARLAADASPTLTLGLYAGSDVGCGDQNPGSHGPPPQVCWPIPVATRACVALTKYCQMAITVIAGGESALHIIPPTPPARNVTLLTQSHLLLCHYFPTLFGAQSPTHDLQPLVAHLTAYQNEQTVCQDHAWQEKNEKEGTMVAVWLGPKNFSRLLYYSQVASKDHLSLFWKVLAGAPARDWLMILQWKVCGELLSMDAVFLA
jgi:hypothetical protein